MRTVLISTLLLLLARKIMAQSNFSLGASYAPTFAKIDDLGDKSKNHRYGQQICLQGKWKTGNHFSYIAGIGYSFLQTEYSSVTPYTGEIFTTWFRHQDILLPLQLQYAYSSRPGRLIFIGGLIPSINMHRKVQQTSHYPYSAPSFAYDVTDEQGYRWLDAFITLGIGYEYTLKEGGCIYIEPNFRTNFLTELLYIPKYLSHKQDEPYPPGVNTVGIEVGYFFK